MAYTKYSLTPADNNAAPPNGAPEGMLPSAVNDTMRDMMAQIRDVGDGIRGGTYTMTAPVITGGSITGVALSGNTLTNPVITGGSINNATVGATTRSTGAFTTLASNGATTFTAGTASTSTTTGTAVITGGLGVSGRINAANFDGIVGANTAAAGNFTTLGATGVATFSAGTVSAPAITTTGDTNTGIYFPAADTIAFTEGGVESMRIDSAGNVGIGVSGFAEKLVVAGPAVARGQLGNLVSSSTTIDYNSSNVGRIIATGPDASTYPPIVFANTTTTTYAERMRIDSSGNVIVGGTAPVYGASGRGVITINGSSTALLGFTAGGTDKGFLFHDGTNMLLSNTVSAAMLFQTANTERMRIDASGNVGIGTSSFLFGSAGRGVLELNGSASSLLALKRNDNNSAYIFANSAALEIVNVEATPTTFFTNATERMRIASDGRVLIGTSTNFNASFVSVVAGSNRGMGISSSASTAHVLQVDNNNTAYADSGGGMLYIQGAGTTETAYRAISVYGAGARFAVRGDGTIYSTNTSVQSISDVRFKENIKDIDTGLEEILKIQPRRFDWKEGKGTGEKNVAGFIAQEIETVFPELVSEFKDQLDDETMYKSVGYAGLIPSLVKAIQEQQTLINNLTTRLNALEGK